MKIGALKAMILFNGVKEICWCYLRFSRIWVNFFTVNVHKNVLSVFEVRANLCSEIHILLTGVNELHLLSDLGAVQYKRCAHSSGGYLHIL